MCLIIWKTLHLDSAVPWVCFYTCSLQIWCFMIFASELWYSSPVPGVDIIWWYELLGQRQLIHIQSQQMSCAEDGHHHTQGAENQHADGAAEYPPPHQTKKHPKIHSGGERGQGDTCRRTNKARLCYHFKTLLCSFICCGIYLPAPAGGSPPPSPLCSWLPTAAASVRLQTWSVSGQTVAGSTEPGL